MSNLLWLQNWYVKHSYYNTIDITIKTTGTRGWSIIIDLNNTEYDKLPEYLFNSDKPEYDKYKIELKDRFFRAEGNFTKLDFLLGKFRELIGEAELHKKKYDYFWDEKIQEFLFEDEQDLMIFMHYTFKKHAADNIIATGFRFYDFDKTAAKANNFATELNYNHNIRKQFGDYIVIICFSKELYLHYLGEIDKASKTQIKVEEILCEKPADLNEDQELVFTLHHKFIKGYINYYTKEIVKNPDFDPYFDSEAFSNYITR